MSAHLHWLLERAMALSEALMLERKKNRLVNLPIEGASLDDIERDALEQALDRVGWVQCEAAKLLHISPRVIHYKIHHVHKLEPPPWMNKNEKPKKNTGT